MSVLRGLSSQTGDRTEASNKLVAQKCLRNPALLRQIASGLASDDPALAGDCAEVMTNVAMGQPALVAPWARALVPLLRHRNTRARWEAAHALALVAPLVPRLIRPRLAELAWIIRTDRSVIVRDYATKIVAGCAGTDPAQARAAFPALVAAAAAWEGRHAHHALPGLVIVAALHPSLRSRIRSLAEGLTAHPRGVVRKAAAALRDLGTARGRGNPKGPGSVRGRGA